MKNNAGEQNLEAVLETERQKEQYEAFKARTEGYVPQTAKDELGVLRESPGYGQKKCRVCYGRGYQINVLKSLKGEAGILNPVVNNKGSIVGSRYYSACKCQEKGYVKARRVAEAHAISAEKSFESQA